MLTEFEMFKDAPAGEENNNADDTERPITVEKTSESTTPSLKKKYIHKKNKSNGIKTGGSSGSGAGGSAYENEEGDGGFEFHIVSLDNKQWFFEANSADEREEWVSAIEQQILNSLQVLTLLYRFHESTCSLKIVCRLEHRELQSQSWTKFKHC